jgi:hypothetical protein
LDQCSHSHSCNQLGSLIIIVFVTLLYMLIVSSTHARRGHAGCQCYIVCPL